MSQRTYGNEIDSGLSIGSHVFQADPAGAFHGDVPFSMRTTRHGFLSLLDRHVIQQDRFRAVFESFFQLCQGSHLDFDRL